jgi:hypothetical protein
MFCTPEHSKSFTHILLFNLHNFMMWVYYYSFSAADESQWQGNLGLAQGLRTGKQQVSSQSALTLGLCSEHSSCPTTGLWGVSCVCQIISSWGQQSSLCPFSITKLRDNLTGTELVSSYTWWLILQYWKIQFKFKSKLQFNSHMDWESWVCLKNMNPKHSTPSQVK